MLAGREKGLLRSWGREGRDIRQRMRKVAKAALPHAMLLCGWWRGRKDDVIVVVRAGLNAEIVSSSE